MADFEMMSNDVIELWASLRRSFERCVLFIEVFIFWNLSIFYILFNIIHTTKPASENFVPRNLALEVHVQSIANTYFVSFL